MKFLTPVILLCLSFFISDSWAQQYTSSDKKAIRHFEDAAQLLEMRRFEEALDLTRAAIERDNQFAEAWLLQADIQIESGNIDGAVVAMEQAVKVNPGFFPNKYFTLGKLYMEQERYEEAGLQFNTFLEFREANPVVRENARRELNNCEFAASAVKTPVPFEPVNLGENVNSWMAEYYPSITVDGKQLLFTREVKQSNEQARGQEDFYLSEWDGQKWSQAVPITYINTPGNEGAPAISPDGLSMVFTACDLYGSYGPEREGFGSCDLFFSYKIGDRWAKPKNMGPNINTAHWESQPSISADGKTLYFVRGNRNPAQRNSDIYMAQLDSSGDWSKPVKLNNAINTDGNEESVLIHPDGKTLYFSSDGHPGMGGLDIFVSSRLGENEWSRPVNLGYPINTYSDENSLLVSPKGDIAYFSSNRLSGNGDLDLYSFELPENVRPNPVSYVSGIVYDAGNQKPLYASFELIDIETGDVVVSAFSDNQDGSFLVALPFNRRYALNASKKGYLFYSDHFDLMEDSEVRSGAALKVPLKKVTDGETIVLNNVFFDTDKFELKPESRAELNKLADFMNSNPGVQIEVGGHTDNQGSASHNQTLSQNRAKSVSEFLIQRGIDGSRLTAKGYGQDKPIASNDNEKGRAENRRTEIKIIAK